MPEFCQDHSELVKGVGRLEEGQTNIKNTVQNISEKIDGLTRNGFSRDKHDATVDALHKKEQELLEKEKSATTAKREHGWVHWLLVSAGGATVLVIIEKFVPRMFIILGQVFK